MLALASLFLAAMVVYCVALVVCAKIFNLPLRWQRALGFSAFAFPFGFGVAFLLLTSGKFDLLAPLASLAVIQMVLGYAFLGGNTPRQANAPNWNGVGAAVAAVASLAVGVAAFFAFVLAAVLAPPGSFRVFH
jgi:hypothetical protein